MSESTSTIAPTTPSDDHQAAAENRRSPGHPPAASIGRTSSAKVGLIVGAESEASVITIATLLRLLANHLCVVVDGRIREEILFERPQQGGEMTVGGVPGCVN